MSGRRVGWVVTAVLIGIGGAILRDWWVVLAMVLMVVAQIDAERRDRRRSQKVEPPAVRD